MNIFNHPLCNEELPKPSDMTDEQCALLPVCVMDDEAGRRAISFRKPDAAELEVLTAGGTVQLWVRASGRQHPVVAVGAALAV